MIPSLALGVSGVVPVSAATVNWSGGGANTSWSSAANWGGLLPTGNDALVFSGTTGLANVNDLLASTGAVTFNSGGFNVSGNNLQLNGDFTSAGNNTWAINSTLGGPRTFTSSSGIFTLSGALSNGGNLTTITGTGNTVISGILGGSGGLAKTGIGTLTLNAANTYSGVTTISAGRLEISSDANLGSSPSIAMSGNIVIAGDATLYSSTTLTLNANRGIAIGPSGSVAAILSVSSGKTLTYDGIISNSGTSTGGLTKSSSSGILVLGGANTYSGNTTIRDGTLRVTHAAAIPSGPGKGNLDLSTINSALELNGNSITINGLTGIGSIRTNLAGPATLTVGANDQSSTFSGTIVNGSGVVGLSKTGSGTLTLAGANTYSGDTSILTGTLKLTNAAAIPSGSGKGNLSVASGGTLDVNNLNVTLNGLSGSGKITNGQSGHVTLAVGGNGASGSFSGVIQDGLGQVSLGKTGIGTLSLNGVNTYRGITTITAGTLEYNGSLTGSGGALTAGNNGVLSGSGILDRAVTVASGGTHAPGVGGVGNQSINGNLTYQTGSIFSWDLDSSSTATGFDTVTSNATARTLNVEAGATLRIVLGLNAADEMDNPATLFWQTDQTWAWSTIFRGFTITNGFDAVQITGQSPDLLSQGSFSTTASGVTWSGVPEPSSALIGLLVAAGLLRRRRV